MKKLISLTLCAMVVFFLYACGCEMAEDQTIPSTVPTTVTTVPPTTAPVIPSTSPTLNTTEPDMTILPDPTLESMLPDSNLLDTGESGKDHLG